MLRYLSSGVRDQNNVSWFKGVEVRTNWEFMAIIKGSAKPECADGTDFTFLPKRLWIMPPMSAHRWRVREGEQCEVIVMHFASLPSVMQRFISYERVTSIPLSPRDIATIGSIHKEVLPHYEQPKLECVVWFEKALIDLCILIVGKLKRSKGPDGYDSSAIKVQQALDWYRIHLVHSPRVADLCKALEVSDSMLRRIFNATLKETPRQAFRRLALDEACRMMVESSLSLKEIAFRCGFADAGQFYRVFQRHFHTPPSKWRDNLFYGEMGFHTHSH